MPDSTTLKPVPKMEMELSAVLTTTPGSTPVTLGALYRATARTELSPESCRRHPITSSISSETDNTEKIRAGFFMISSYCRALR
ncbi:MAG: hypothetical protein ACLFU8_17490 [Anaerolineales bacterium]